MSFQPPQQSFPKARGLLGRGQQSDAAASAFGRGPTSAPGSTPAGAFSRPRTQPASSTTRADLDSLDLLLGGPPAATTRARPLTSPAAPAPAPVHSAATSSGVRPAIRANLFEDDDLLLPDDGDPLSSLKPPASQLNTAASPPTQDPDGSFASGAPCLQPNAELNPEQHGLASRALSGSFDSALPQQGPTPVHGALQRSQPGMPAEHRAAIKSSGSRWVPAGPTGQQQEVHPAEREERVQWLAGRCADLEKAEKALTDQVTQLEARCRELEGQLAQAGNEAAVEQMLSEIDKLAAAKKQAEQQAQQLGERAQEAEARLVALEAQHAEAVQSASQLSQELQQSKEALSSLQEASAEQQAELAARLAAAEAHAVGAERAQALVQQREAELAAVRQQAEALGAQLAAAQERGVRAEVAADGAREGHGQAVARAEAVEAQLREVLAERGEAVQHLSSSQRIARELELHLKTVAGERDAALAQLRHVDGKLRAATARLQHAQELEAANARRTEELQALQQEADSLSDQLKERESAVAAREKVAAAQLKQVTNKYAELEGREALVQERLEDAVQQEQGAAALRQELFKQQREVDRQRAALAQQRAQLETAQAQVEREAAAAAQERATLAELRSQRLGEQEALIAALAEERAAAAQQQADAERAVDAAKRAELSAAKVLADLRAQADSAKKQAEAAERRQEHAREQCGAEEARLDELRTAGSEQQRAFEEQAKALMELGKNVKAQSEEMAGAYAQLQRDREALEAERAELQHSKAELQAQQRAMEACRAEHRQALQAVQEQQVSLTSERRRAAEDKAESLRAAEALRQAQLQLATHLQATGALAGPFCHAPAVAEALQRLREAGLAALAPPAPTGSAMLAAPPAAAAATQPPVAAAALSPAALAETASPAVGQATAPAGADMPCKENSPPGSAGEAVGRTQAAPQPAPAQQGHGDDSTRYRLMLAELETSIDTWRAQLRSGQPMEVGNIHSPRTSFRHLLAGPDSPAASPRGPQRAEQALSSSPPLSPVPQQQQQQPADQPQQQRQQQAAQPSSPSRGVQTAVSYVDSVRLASCVAGSLSVPPAQASPASQGPPSAAAEGGQRGKLKAGSALPPAPSASRGAGRKDPVDDGEGVAPRGASVVLDATYSIPGKQESRARKWLKFKAPPSPAAGEGGPGQRPPSRPSSAGAATAGGGSGPPAVMHGQQPAHGREQVGSGTDGGAPAATQALKAGKSWPSIFTFRRSGDGTAVLPQRHSLDRDEDFTIPSHGQP